MKVKICMAVLIFLFASIVLGASTTQAGPFGEIVVFGDSLSDNGNLLLVEYQPLPDPELYWEGHFSNGAVWVDYLANATHFNTNLIDRAIGGAQSDGLIPPGVIQQVATHILVTGSPLSPNNLYVIWIGGNDHLNGNVDFQEVVDNINEAMTKLADDGAMSMLIMNLPDLGFIPDTLGTNEAPQATAFSENFNAALANMIDTFRAAHQEIKIYEFDVEALFLKVRANPVTFGFINVTQPSPNFSVPDNFDGAGYLFWDDRHPTTQMHALIAGQVFNEISAQLPSEAPDTSAQDNDSSGCFMQAMTWRNPLSAGHLLTRWISGFIGKPE